MKKSIHKNGIFGGIIVSIVMISMTLFMKTYPDREPNAIIGFSSMLLAFVFVICGIKQERETNSGLITFGRAFLSGLSISELISTIYVIV